MIRGIFRLLAASFAAVTTAGARPPAMPANVEVRAIGVNAFEVEWEDKANNEVGTEFFASIGGAKPLLFFTLRGQDVERHIFMTPEIPGQRLSLQLRTFNAEGEFSDLTPVLKTDVPDDAVFGKPENFAAEALPDGGARLTWADKANCEVSYEIQYKQPDGKDWESLGSLPTDDRYRIPVGDLDPETQYSFRVRALRETGAVTEFSAAANVTTRAFAAPAELEATALPDGKFELGWKDRSSAENGFEVEIKTGAEDFRKLGEYPANAEEVPDIGGLVFGADYAFRVRGFRTNGDERIFTSYSNIARGTARPLAKPAALEVANAGIKQVTLTWKDQSSQETGFEILGKTPSDSTFKVLGTATANANSQTIGNLTAGTTFEFAVRAIAPASKSALSNIVSAKIKDGVILENNQVIFVGKPFAMDVEISRPDAVKEINVGELPAGLRFDRASGKILGTPSSSDLVRTEIVVRFNGGFVSRETITFRALHPRAAPMVTRRIADADVAKGGRKILTLTRNFRDPDVSLARRVKTNAGTLDVVLYENATPLTVENFLSYADGKDYNQSFFHRSVADFVVQGGGYVYDGKFSKVETGAGVRNEPGISNKPGTIAMAKFSDKPNSATSQFFFNVVDNSANLDAQNGGFTVFGRVTGKGLDVLEKINGLPRGNYSVPLDGGTENLGDVPMRVKETAPAGMEPEKLVRISKITPVRPLRFTAESSKKTVATVKVVGNKLVIRGLKKGRTEVKVIAKDLDGKTTSQTFEITVK